MAAYRAGAADPVEIVARSYARIRALDDSAVFISLRRWFVLTPGTHVEARMRNALYEKLQDLPVSFHDKWPSGQLLSRAVSDLSLIRRWLSFGIVLLVVNVVTIIVGFAIGQNGARSCVG